MSIKEKQNLIIEEFSYFDDWQDRYEYLICLIIAIKPFAREGERNS